MPTSSNPYIPPAAPATTTVAQVYATTTIVCTPTTYNISLAARKSQQIAIPAIGFTSPVGGNAQFVNLTIVAVPGVGTLKVGAAGATLVNGATIALSDLANLIYTAPSNFTGTTTFTYKIVTTCGQTATMTATITAAPDLPIPCAGCPSTTIAP